MATIRIPTPLRTYTDGASEVTVPGSTVAGVLDNLSTSYPALRVHIFKEAGELRPFVNLFLNQENINELQGLLTPLNENDRLMLIPSIAGG